MEKLGDRFIKFTANCPVRLDVYTSDGKKVGMVNDEMRVYLKDDHDFILIQEGESKCVYMPETADYIIKVAGEDEGQTTLIVEKFDGDSPVGRALYSDIQVEDKSTMRFEIKGGTGKSTTITASNDEGAINGVYIDGSSDATVAINANISGKGSVYGGGEYIKGDKVILRAVPDDDYGFCGWYSESDGLVSLSNEFSFDAMQPQTYTAKFMAISSTDDLENVDKVLDILSELERQENPSKEDVQKAKQAYNSLSDEQKKLIDSDTMNTFKATEDKFVEEPSKKEEPSKENAGQRKSSIKKEVVDLPMLRIVKPKVAKKSASIKWKKVSKKNQKQTAKIEIQYSTDKKFKKNVKTVYAKKTAVSKKITKLKPKTTYYFRIRAYKKARGVLHVSKWSKVKKAKIK